MNRCNLNSFSLYPNYASSILSLAPPNTFNFIADTGASGHYVPSSYFTLLHHVQQYQFLTVTLPVGSRIQSTHVGLLLLPQFPMPVRRGFVFPGLRHSLLFVPLLLYKFYDAA